MEARWRTVAAVAACITLAAFATAAPPLRNVSMSRPVGYRTTNFTVRAPSRELAREIGDAAEQWRSELAMEWLGKSLEDWPEPCPITAHVSPRLGAGGATSFMFDRGQVYGWEMNIQGSRERVLDSVLPHEITHTIFATHFRQPLPRWADEGACTTVEHRSEVAKQERMLINFLQSRPTRGIDFKVMFEMTEYPSDIMPLYAQGHSLTQFLIEGHGKRTFMAFLTDGLRDRNWRRAVETHYGHADLYALQDEWLAWVRAGRPRLDRPVAALAAASQPAPIPPTGALAASGRSVAGRASVYARTDAPTGVSRTSVYDASNRGGTTYLR